MRKLKYTPEQLRELVEKKSKEVELMAFDKKYLDLYTRVYGSGLGWTKNLWQGVKARVSEVRAFELILGLPVEAMPKDTIGCYEEVTGVKV